MKIDVIFCHPIHLQYPLWQQQIRDQRKYFDKVIVSFTQMNAKGDYRKFIRDSMGEDNIIFVDNEPAQAKEDWRNQATNKALSFSNSDWVLFSEQDFLIYNPGLFWKMIEDLAKPSCEVIGYMQDKRLHPAFLLIKRETLNKTSRNFSVIPDKEDHFAIVAKEIDKFPKALIFDTGSENLFHHMNGLSQNMYLLQSGREPNFRPTEFKKYCKECLEVKVPQHPDFIELFSKYVEIN